MEIFSFTESLKHWKLICSIKYSSITLEFWFVSQSMFFQLVLVYSLVYFQEWVLRLRTSFILSWLWRLAHWRFTTLKNASVLLLICKECNFFLLLYWSNTLTYILFSNFFNNLWIQTLIHTISLHRWDPIHGFIFYVNNSHLSDWWHIFNELLVQWAFFTYTCFWSTSTCALFLTCSTCFYMYLFPGLLSIKLCLHLVLLHLQFLLFSLIQFFWVLLLSHFSHSICFGFRLELHQFCLFILLFLLCFDLMNQSVMLSWLKAFRWYLWLIVACLRAHITFVVVLTHH